MTEVLRIVNSFLLLRKGERVGEKEREREREKEREKERERKREREREREGGRERETSHTDNHMTKEVPGLPWCASNTKRYELNTNRRECIQYLN